MHFCFLVVFYCDVSRSGDTEKALLHRETPYSPLHVPHPAAPIACRFGSDLTSAAAFEPMSIMNQLGPDRVYGTCLRVAHNHPRRKQTRRSDRGQWPEPAWARTRLAQPPGPPARLARSRLWPERGGAPLVLIGADAGWSTGLCGGRRGVRRGTRPAPGQPPRRVRRLRTSRPRILVQDPQEVRVRHRHYGCPAIAVCDELGERLERVGVSPVADVHAPMAARDPEQRAISDRD